MTKDEQVDLLIRELTEWAQTKVENQNYDLDNVAWAMLCLAKAFAEAELSPALLNR